MVLNVIHATQPEQSQKHYGFMNRMSKLPESYWVVPIQIKDAQVIEATSTEMPNENNMERKFKQENGYFKKNGLPYWFYERLQPKHKSVGSAIKSILWRRY